MKQHYFFIFSYICMMLATSSLNMRADDVLSGTFHTGIDNLNIQL